MDLQEAIVLRIQREREREKAIQLLTTDPKVYKELLTHHRRGTNGSGEPLRDGVQIGSGGSGLYGGWMNISTLLLGFLEYCGIYRAKRRSGGTRGGHNPPGRAWASWRALVGCALLGAPPRRSQGLLCSFWSKKISVKFRGIWTPSEINFLRRKKHAENSNSHLALCKQVSTKK